MKFALLSSASVVALFALAVPASADTEFTGVGQVFVGLGSTEGFNNSIDNPFTFGAQGKGYWPLSPDVHLQVDLLAQQAQDVTRNWASDDDVTTLGAAVHLLHPFENRARLGFAASVWDTDVFLPDGDGRTDPTYGLAAIEGQFFGSDWTVTGQGGAFTTLSCKEGGEECFVVVEDGTFVRGKIRYFLHDNTAISLDVTRMWGTFGDDVFGGKSMDTEIWSFVAEHRFQDTPWAGSIELSHENTQVNTFGTDDTNSVFFSLKYYYGQPTLRANDKSGAELDTPTFSHPLAIGGPLAESVL